MAEYSANGVQTIPPGGSAVFTTTDIPCNMGLVMHMDDTPSFLLNGWNPSNDYVCCCCSNRYTEYKVDFGANIAVATGGTAEAISVAIAIDGTSVPSSTMIATPAGVEEYFNVGRRITVPIFSNCCQTLTITNTSTQSILMQNAVLNIDRPNLV